MNLLDLKAELEKILSQASNSAGQVANYVGQSVANIPQVQQARFGVDIAKGFTGQLSANQQKAGGQNFAPNPQATYKPQNVANQIGQKALGLANDLTIWQMSGLNAPIDQGFRAASPYIRQAVAPIQDFSGEVFNKIVQSLPKIKSVVQPTRTITTQAVETGNKDLLKGLLSESPAQTAFRRSGGVTAKEMYAPSVPPIMPSANDAGYTPVIKKVNIFDYLRTPENVLKKIGLEDQTKLLRKQWDSYQTQLPEELNKIESWMSQVPGPESSKKIFNFLDGKLQQSALTPEEVKVGLEIKSYLRSWAVKLRLPVDKQVSSYITHIFEKGANEAEFNDEVAKLIDQKVAGSVYNPFLQKRTTNDIPYVQDVWRALQAYTKRAVRGYNMDPVLETLKNSSDSLELSQYKYVSRLTDRINMRPTETDTLIDNLIKQSPVGYKLGQRPVANVSKAIRQQIYRGGLGLNVSSALRNLTQGVNTYAKLGEKYTTVGYLKLFRNWNSQELEQVGVLRDSFIEDKSLSVFKGTLEKIDKGLFYLFEQVEKINRGSAYYGAKAQALDKGMTEQQAIEYATALVRKTQFVFGSIDTPVALQSDLVKTFTQFGTYSVKQIEFLAEMAKNKEYAGLIRYTAATLALMKVFKDSFGMSLDLLPQIGLSPVGQIVTNVGPAMFGNDQQKAAAQKKLLSTGTMLIPGGIQGKKTLEGLTNYFKGESTAPGGGMRFPIEQNTPNLIKSGLLGPSAVPEAQDYYDNHRNVLGMLQSEAVRQAQNQQEAYNQLITKREENAAIERVKKLVEQTGQPQQFSNSFVFIDDGGSTKTIDLSFQPKRPQLTGNSELDKQLMSKYNSEVTKKKNDILTLYNLGQIDASGAEQQLQDLAKVKISTGGSRAKGSLAQFKIKAPPKIKIVAAKLPKMMKVKKAPTPKKFKNKRIVVKPVKTTIKPISLGKAVKLA